MKVVKRIVTVLVLCLAVVGAFSLLKKAPNLAPSEDDLLYLEQELGKSASAVPSREGLSGVMMNVEGAPPITGFEMTGASSAPPAFMSETATAAPAFAPSHLEPSAAPPFIAAAEAPPFMQAAPTAPVASPYQPATEKLEEAPAFETPTLPRVAPIEPAKEPVPVSVTTSGTSIYECSILEPIVPTTKSPPPRTESPPPFQEVLLAWNGPVTEVINMPSSASNEPQEGCNVLEETESERKDSSDMVRAESELLKNETPIVALSPYKRLPVVMEEPEVKIIATIEEEKPSDSEPVEQAAVVTMKIEPETKDHTVVQADEKPTRESDRPTPAPQDIGFDDPLQIAKAKEPIVSFTTSKIDLPADVPNFRPTTSVQPPASMETSAMPFAKSDVLPVQPVPTQEGVQTDSVALSTVDSTAVPESDLSKVLRPTVTRFVKAQSTLANSGNPIKMRNAFIQLSKLYEQSELNDAERSYMKPLLDRLALSVVYSRNIHILEPAYVVKSGDSVESIAETHLISSDLLRKINGLAETQPVGPGNELKVVQGRFDAKISGSRGELTLLLGGLYAGCFPVLSKERLGDLRGEFYVATKTNSASGRKLTLNNGLTICDDRFSGTSNVPVVRLKEQDLRELFDILSEMSVIVFEN